MAKHVSVQDGGIVFGDWKLFPVDSHNWELCHRHAATRGKNEGVEQWNRLGRFYSWNTFGNALMFAADCELKDGTAEAARDIHAALAEYRAITSALAAEVSRALGEGEE